MLINLALLALVTPGYSSSWRPDAVHASEPFRDPPSVYRPKFRYW